MEKSGVRKEKSGVRKEKRGCREGRDSLGRKRVGWVSRDHTWTPPGPLTGSASCP